MDCRDILGLGMALPPPPLPTKDLTTKEPFRTSSATSSPDIIPLTTTSPPPNRPLPPTPSSKKGTAHSRSGSMSSNFSSPRSPPPTRPPPLKSQASLTTISETRPETASSLGKKSGHSRLHTQSSWTSLASTTRTIKYGRGKHSGVELVPQPSDNPEDPLNWPRWRKESSHYALLLMVALTGVMKTAFISVNVQAADWYRVSYTAAAALTGVPLILSAFTGLVSLVTSRICGKRPLYLISLLLLFIGTIWNTSVRTSYSQCLAARVFQGLGWGAFDTLVQSSIYDLFFEHERNLRVSIYTIVAITTTWGPPLLGGVSSRGQTGFELQFTILSCFFVLAVPTIALGVPETAYDRTYTLPQIDEGSESPYKASMCQGIRRDRIVDTINDYIVKMKPYSYRGSANRVTLLQVPRAFVAPTTLILFFTSLLPYSSLWAFSSSLSLLFHSAYTTTIIGVLMMGPWLLATATAAILTLLPLFLSRLKSQFPVLSSIPTQFSNKVNTAAITAGSILAFIGVLAFGLHTDAGIHDGKILGTNLPAISFTLGLLAAGAYVLDAICRPLIRLSTASASSSDNHNIATRTANDMAAGVTCWRTLFAGILIIAVPSGISSPRSSEVMSSGHGLRDMCIGFAVVQIVIAAAVGSAWWFFGEETMVWDGRVMKLGDSGAASKETSGREGSFFDTD
ncbi:major facilitator superfamily domain-containing protein [Copromyces sp. CBS 386.78]|nr:major facilitator superfamily domain-containing protein [Copromyces sp. CBS 386.78]